MSQDLYRTLQERLDTYSLGFPATKSGVEIELLQELFTDDDARVFLALSPMLETPEAIAGKTGLSADEARVRLEDMAARGLLFRSRKGDTLKYGAIPFMHGLVEFNTLRMSHRFAELLERYFREGFSEAIARTSGLFLRTIPIEHSITPEHHVASFDDAAEILKKANTIVVSECTCRKHAGILGHGCGKPLETCFMFGSMARYYIDFGIGREVGYDEAIDILKRCNEAGLVVQPGTAQNPSGMCNCCGDCCAVLRGLKLLPRPAEAVFSNHYAVVDASLCTGCEACVERCQMEALSLNDLAGVIAVDPDRCIGCGLCVTACPTEALSLEAKAMEALRTPPANGMEQMMELARKRGLL